eukprot:8982120-Pyramimonas_sp.AAC.1
MREVIFLTVTNYMPLLNPGMRGVEMPRPRSAHSASSPGVDRRPTNWQSVDREYSKCCALN